MAPFKGFLAGADESAQYHGYGLSAFVKYMQENYSEKNLVKVYEHELSGSTDIVGGFNSAYGINLSDIYDDFLNAYIMGDIYNDFGVANLLGEISGTFSVNSYSDTLASFESSFPALSAKVYKIDINYQEFTEQNSMLIHSDGMKKLIYKVSGGDLSFLGSFSGDYSLTNLNEIQEENALILVVMLSHYYSESNGLLELKIEATDPADFNGVRYKLDHIDALEEVILPGGSTTTQEVSYDFTYDYGLIGEYLEGTYNNGTFEANWNYEYNWNYRSIGNMQLIIDEQSQKIISGSIHGRLESIDNPENGYETLDISFENISATYWGENDVTFSVFSSDFCDSNIISDFDEMSFYNNFHRTLTSYSCNSYTEFVIKLRKSND